MSDKLVVLRGEHGNCFMTLYREGVDYSKTADGKISYEVLGIVDSNAEGQEVITRATGKNGQIRTFDYLLKMNKKMAEAGMIEQDEVLENTIKTTRLCEGEPTPEFIEYVMTLCKTQS